MRCTSVGDSQTAIPGSAWLMNVLGRRVASKLLVVAVYGRAASKQIGVWWPDIALIDISNAWPDRAWKSHHPTPRVFLRGLVFFTASVEDSELVISPRPVPTVSF